MQTEGFKNCFWLSSATSLRQVQQKRPFIVTRRLRRTTPERLRQLQKKWISSVASRVPGTAAHPPQRNRVHHWELSSVQERQYIPVVMVYSATSMRNMQQKWPLTGTRSLSVARRWS